VRLYALEHEAIIIINININININIFNEILAIKMPL
jgi:hypothetical protein